MPERPARVPGAIDRTVLPVSRDGRRRDEGGLGRVPGGVRWRVNSPGTHDSTPGDQVALWRLWAGELARMSTVGSPAGGVTRARTRSVTTAPQAVSYRIRVASTATRRRPFWRSDHYFRAGKLGFASYGPAAASGAGYWGHLGGAGALGVSTADLTILALGRPEVSASSTSRRSSDGSRSRTACVTGCTPWERRSRGPRRTSSPSWRSWHAVPFDEGVPRVYTVLKLDERRTGPTRRSTTRWTRSSGCSRAMPRRRTPRRAARTPGTASTAGVAAVGLPQRLRLAGRS